MSVYLQISQSLPFSWYLLNTNIKRARRTWLSGTARLDSASAAHLALTASILLKSRGWRAGGCCCPVCCWPGCVFVSRALGYDGFLRTSILPSSICRPKTQRKGKHPVKHLPGSEIRQPASSWFHNAAYCPASYPREGAPLFCCLLLGLAAVPYTPAVVPGPPTSQLYREALLGSRVPLASL